MECLPGWIGYIPSNQPDQKCRQANWSGIIHVLVTSQKAKKNVRYKVGFRDKIDYGKLDQIGCFEDSNIMLNISSRPCHFRGHFRLCILWPEPSLPGKVECAIWHRCNRTKMEYGAISNNIRNCKLQHPHSEKQCDVGKQAKWPHIKFLGVGQTCRKQSIKGKSINTLKEWAGKLSSSILICASEQSVWINQPQGA